MLSIRIICVGRLKEKFYTAASGEYLKRLTAYCKAEVIEIPEAKRSGDPSPKEIEAALLKEAAGIEEKIPQGAMVVAMCIEGKLFSSEDMAALINRSAISCTSKLCFIIGGSDGLHKTVKDRADVKMSMSPMTFPHHLARVMLLEQIYRGFKINEGSKYHK
jgi:23S rRNA (pseudouridine1915-N3)-methyltransferase